MDRILSCPRVNSLFRYHDRITCAIRHVEQHLELPTSLQLFAKQCGVSQFHFHRVFRELYGEPPGEYVRRLRLELAARYLIYSDANVDTITRLVGYESPTVFSRAFKRHFRLAPREYRVAKRELPNNKKKEEGFVHGSLTPTAYHYIDNVRVVCVRSTGSDPIAVAQAWLMLEEEEQLKPFFANHPQRIALLYDPPDITPENYRRFDTGIVVPDDFTARGVLTTCKIYRGYYARFVNTKPPNEIWQTCREIFDHWAVLVRAPLATVPLLVWYVESSDGINTEVYVPMALT